ncbi:MAG: hypothetical protein MUO78_00880 [candidate division Zixibacteria bacterium]|nr:hypothetical protein [candidate division Zixibacteria bacterium]
MIKIKKKVSRLFRSGISVLSSGGIWNFIQAFYLFLFRYEKLIVFEIDLKGEVNQVKSDLSLEIRKATSDDLKNLQNGKYAYQMEMHRNIVDGVEDAFVAFSEGVFAHIVWVYYPGDPNRFIKLKQKETEIKFGWTPLEFRGHNVYPKVVEFICNYLKEKEYERFYGFIVKDNVASMTGLRKVGFQETGYKILLKLFGFQLSPKV